MDVCRLRHISGDGFYSDLLIIMDLFDTHLDTLLKAENEVGNRVRGNELLIMLLSNEKPRKSSTVQKLH